MGSAYIHAIEILTCRMTNNDLWTFPKKSSYYRKCLTRCVKGSRGGFGREDQGSSPHPDVVEPQ